MSQRARETLMVYKITYSHSRMSPDYIGTAVKYAQSEKDALAFLGKYDKKLNVIIDKRGSVLSNIQIHEEK